MEPATVIAIIALIIALVVACVTMSKKQSSSSSADSDQPSTDEGRKIAVVRGTAWVSSTQITCWTDDYTTGG
jgi:hypothetical protein